MNATADLYIGAGNVVTYLNPFDEERTATVASQTDDAVEIILYVTVNGSPERSYHWLPKSAVLAVNGEPIDHTAGAEVEERTSDDDLPGRVLTVGGWIAFRGTMRQCREFAASLPAERKARVHSGL